ncbi:MAG: class B sortase [Defluviitaleaceae bacterium]|nr:class B sortase [Defluviitaleaceae bacterium]
MVDRKKRRLNNILFAAVFVAALGFAASFAFNLSGQIIYRRDGRVAAANSAIIQEIFADISVGADTIRPHYPMAVARNLTHNEDIIAYIAIPGTNVGNVVVQGMDNSHYLYTDAFGQPNVNGALFMDYRNSPSFTDPNTIIYGHNMRNGTMFHNLRYYMNESFWREHPHIVVITDYDVLIYEIFATFSTHVDFYYIQVDFNDERGDFEGLINEMARRAVFDTDIRAARYDRVLILSTCTNIHQDTRFVVAARLLVREY